MEELQKDLKNYKWDVQKECARAMVCGMIHSINLIYFCVELSSVGLIHGKVSSPPQRPLQFTAF
jgi:hypothetical protein